MKKIIFTFFVFFIIQSTGIAISYEMSDVKTYTKESLWGLQATDGTIITDAEYKKLIRIGNNSWLIQKGNKFGIIDTNGNIIVKPKYSHAERVFGKYAKLGTGNKYGLYNEYGENVIPHEYSVIDPLFGEIFLIKKNYLYGIMSNTGEVLLTNDYEYIYMPNTKTMRIKYEGEWFEIEQISNQTEISLPDNAREIILDNKKFKITHLMSTTGAVSGYSVVTMADYMLKIFSSISPAYEQTIDELMLSQGAETVSIFMKLSWIPKFPISYIKNYYLTIKDPYNGPLSTVKSKLKKHI